MANPTDLPTAVRALVETWFMTRGLNRHAMATVDVRDLEARILAWHQGRVEELHKKAALYDGALETIRRFTEREHYWAKALSVADDGQYRADWNGAIENVVAERDHLRADLAAIVEAFKPVRDWYDGDGRYTNLAEMLRSAVEDLQHDRTENLKLRADLDAARWEIARLTKRPFVYLRCAYSHEWIAEDETGQVEKGCPWCLAKEADDAKTDRDLRRIMAQEEMKMRLAAEATARRLRVALEAIGTAPFGLHNPDRELVAVRQIAREALTDPTPRPTD